MERRIRCGKNGCRCNAEPPQLHGPDYQWTRKVKGKTETRLLSAAQLARYGSWFENARRIRTLTSELEALSLEVAESAEDWSRPQPSEAQSQAQSVTSGTSREVATSARRRS